MAYKFIDNKVNKDGAVPATINDYMLYYSRQILQNPRLLIGIPRYYLGNRNEFEFPEKMRVLKKVIVKMPFLETRRLSVLFFKIQKSHLQFLKI